MKFKLLIFVLSLATVPGFAVSPINVDREDAFNKRFSEGLALEGVVKSLGIRDSAMGGNDSFVPETAYCMIRTYRVYGVANTDRPNFVRLLVKAYAEEMKQSGLLLYHQHSGPYEGELCSGLLRGKTAKEDLPSRAAMIDIRLLGADKDSCFVSVTLHHIHLDDPDYYPERAFLKPNKSVPSKEEPKIESRSEHNKDLQEKVPDK